MPRLKPPPAKNVPPELIEAEPPPVGEIEINLDDDVMGGTEIDLDAAPPPSEPSTEPAPPPRTETVAAPRDEDAVARAVEAQKRAEELQRAAMRERDEAVRQARQRDQELERERSEREDAEYNSVLTAMAAEQATLDRAEAAYAAAANAGDWAEAAKAQRAMSIAGARLDRLEDGKRTFDTRRETAKAAPPVERRPAPSGDPVEAQIVQMQVPEEAKTWLRGHKDYLTDPRKNAKLGSAHYEALDAGPMGSAAYIEKLELELGLRQSPADTHTPEPPPAPAPQPRRSMPMTAPPTREVPSANGQRQKSSMTLTQEEREIARSSIVDRPDMPKLTDAQKEYQYARSKAKYQAMKANGSYTDQRR